MECLQNIRMSKLATLIHKCVHRLDTNKFINILIFMIFTSYTPSYAKDDVTRQTLLLLGTGKCERCNLRGASLIYANIKDAALRSSDLSAANLSYSNLDGADLRDSNLSDITLTGSTLRGADLTNAVLHGANLDDVDLTGAKLSTKQLISANWMNAYGIDLMKVDPDELVKATSLLIRNSQLKKADSFFEVLLLRRPGDPELWISRALNRFRIGQEVLAKKDLKHGQQIYQVRGDLRAVKLIEEYEATLDKAMESIPQHAKGNGYGVTALNSIKILLPLLVPLARKALIPY